MTQRTFRLVFGILLCLTPSLFSADLSTATSAELLQVYSQLRAMQGSDQGAVTENVGLKRDAATFRFRSGHLTFAAPVAGRVVVAVFNGDASFQLDPPTPMDQRQLSRFTNEPRLLDTFRNAVFFFTDDTWAQLQKTLDIKRGSDPAEATSAIKSIQDRYERNFNGWWANQRAGNFAVRNLPARILSDLTDPSSQGFFLADFKGEHSGNLLFQISWNRPSFLLPNFASGDEVMLIHYSVGGYSELWSGFHLASEYASNSHPDHSLQYLHCAQEAIDADISKENSLSAAATLKFGVERGTPRVLPFNLEGVLRIDTITDDKGNKVSFIQEPRELDSDPWVVLPAPANPGQANTIKISYHEDSTQESRVILQRGVMLYCVTARESWYPNFGAFDDRTMFDLRFQLPNNKYKFAATGDLAESKEQGQSLTTEWKSPVPFSAAGFNYGDLVQATAKGPDLALTAYGAKQPPPGMAGVAYGKAGQQLDKQAENTRWEPSGMTRMGQQSMLADAETRMAHADMPSLLKQAVTISEQAADFFKFYYGPLPFRTVFVTQVPAGGYAQSSPMVILLPFSSLAEAATLRFLGVQVPADEDRDFHNVPAIREISRQWWGAATGSKTYHDEWLFQGLAEFSAALYIAQFRSAAWNNFWDMEKNSLLTKSKDGRRPVDVGPVWLNYQTGSHDDPEVPGILVYRKGAYIIQMLRVLMRDPKSQNPDAAFIAMMQDFAKTYAGQNASTADFQRIVEKHMGRPMDWFFNEWVYGTETPHYDFSYQLSDAGGGKTLLTMSLKQSEVSNSFVMEVPVYTELNKKVFQLGLIRMQGSTAQSGKFPLAFRPDRIILDANHSILCSISQ
jgi:hypothetical protein